MNIALSILYPLICENVIDMPYKYNNDTPIQKVLSSYTQQLYNEETFKLVIQFVKFSKQQVMIASDIILERKFLTGMTSANIVEYNTYEYDSLLELNQDFEN